MLRGRRKGDGGLMGKRHLRLFFSSLADERDPRVKEQGHAFQRRVQGACACVRASGGGWERLGAPGGQGAALGLARGRRLGCWPGWAAAC